MRITEKTLVSMVERLNAARKVQAGKIGSYRIYKSGCGYAIDKIANDCGGVDRVGNISGMTAKECYFFLSGILCD